MVAGDAGRQARWLLATNVAGMLLAALSGVVVARTLGPERVGVMAVVSGIAASLLAFCDVRLSDVAARAFYQQPGRESGELDAYRLGVMAIAVIGSGAIAGSAALLASVAGGLLVPFFTDSAIASWWLPAASAAIAFNSVSGTIVFLLRLTGALVVMGVCRLATQASGLVVTVLVLRVAPNIDGAYVAALGASGVALVVAMLGARWLLIRPGRVRPLRTDWAGAFAEYRRSVPMILYGNLLGYAKLLQRGADVLLVGLFSSDRETGFYKMARGLTDPALAVPQDALYQVYYPRLLRAFGARAASEHQAMALELLKTAALWTAAILALEVLFLPSVIRLVLGPEFSPTLGPILVLSSTFIFVSGFYPWLWSVFAGSGRLRGFTSCVYLSTAVQYLTALLLFRTAGATALSAAIAATAYYLVLIPTSYVLAARRAPGFLPPLPGR